MSVRGVWQLQRLVVHYCRASGDSSGARSFIQQKLTQFAAANPGVHIEVNARHGKAPTLTAEYLDGTSKVVDVKKQGSEEILRRAEELRDTTTAVVRHLSKPVSTPRPSVQGVWGPDVAFPSFTLREAAGPVPAPSAASAAKPALQ